MKLGEKKTGRPAHYEKREELTNVSFRADAATMAALKTITAAAAAAGVIAPRSVALRRAIQEAADRIEEQAHEPKKEKPQAVEFEPEEEDEA